LAALVAGCSHAEQTRQAQEYERFLKSSLGTVATDAPLQAHAPGDGAAAVD
jgi:hypothetical protein